MAKQTVKINCANKRAGCNFVAKGTGKNVATAKAEAEIKAEAHSLICPKNPIK